MENFGTFLDWATKAMMGGIVGYGVHILSGMKNSIDQLNVQVGKIVERTEWHSKEIERLDNRLMRVESVKPVKSSHCPSTVR